ncbi:MAG: TetR-like C-terminal domain-containing protein [Eubacteriales bacterium]|nr:TetR-like C-terminal domain-containing protein [Eubacteriales bacterium]
MATSKERNTYVKEQITSTLLNMLKKKSLSEITISMLVKEAQVGRASFYRNYESLEDVIAQYDKKIVHAWAETFAVDPNASAHNVFTSLFRHYKEHEDFYMMLYRNDMTYLIRDTIYHRAGIQTGMSDNESYRLAFLSYGIYGWVCEWMKRGMKEIPEDVTQIFPNGLSL